MGHQLGREGALLRTPQADKATGAAMSFPLLEPSATDQTTHREAEQIEAGGGAEARLQQRRQVRGKLANAWTWESAFLWSAARVIENAKAADLPPPAPATMEAVQEVYDSLVRPLIHHRW